MKSLVVFFCLVALAVTAPAPRSDDVYIVKSEMDNIGDGNYKFYYELSDGTKREEKGELRNADTENAYVYVTGYYAYTGNDGVNYLVKYTSGTEGYEPEIEQGPGGGVPTAVVASLLG